jgi:hypothetical protein
VADEDILQGVLGRRRDLRDDERDEICHFR